MAQLEGTAFDGENKFNQWLLSHNVKSSMIKKLTQNGIESIDMIQEIDEIDVIAKHLDLNPIEKLKLKTLIKAAACVNLHVIVDNEERESIIRMTHKIKAMEESIKHIQSININIDKEILKCNKLGGIKLIPFTASMF